jgi:hypothetical protein
MGAKWDIIWLCQKCQRDMEQVAVLEAHLLFRVRAIGWRHSTQLDLFENNEPPWGTNDVFGYGAKGGSCIELMSALKPPSTPLSRYYLSRHIYLSRYLPLPH